MEGAMTWGDVNAAAVSLAWNGLYVLPPLCGLGITGPNIERRGAVIFNAIALWVVSIAVLLGNGIPGDDPAITTAIRWGEWLFGGGLAAGIVGRLASLAESKPSEPKPDPASHRIRARDDAPTASVLPMSTDWPHHRGGLHIEVRVLYHMPGQTGAGWIEGEVTASTATPLRTAGNTFARSVLPTARERTSAA